VVGHVECRLGSGGAYFIYLEFDQQLKRHQGGMEGIVAKVEGRGQQQQQRIEEVVEELVKAIEDSPGDSEDIHRHG
jgi:hypothetical protein